MPPIRIVVADDHTILRDGLKRLLETEADFEVVGEAASGREAIRMVRERAPDVLLLDLSMPDGSGLEVLRALHDAPVSTRTILLTAGIERDEILEALGLGVRGLVLKHSATPLLHKCIRAVVAGEYWLGHDRIPDLIDAVRRLKSPSPATPAQTLTVREMRVIAAVVEGATNREIAEQLGMSEQTVKNHLSHIFDKVGVSNRLELALFAIHHKLIPSAQRKTDPRSE
jgi:two-component system nitrate/nitrite response regulator NarL